jgi:hypothetical protein
MRDYVACFLGEATPEVVAAAKALAAAGNPEYPAGCVLAQQRDARLAAEGYTVAKSGSIRRLVGKRRVGWTDDPDVMPDAPPGDDHGDLYCKDGQPAFYLSQPYGVTFATLQKVVKFCERWGLEASIDSLQSTWFPSLTVAIKYQTKGKPDAV